VNRVRPRVDLDYRSPRGISVRQAVNNMLARAVRTPGGCLIGVQGPDRYQDIKASGTRLGGHVAVVLVRGDEMPLEAQVRHTCDVKGCVESSHLIVGTPSQNSRDAVERERRRAEWPRGEALWSATLTEDDVVELRRRVRAGESLSEVAASVAASYAAVRSAVRGETWQHVTRERPVPGRRNRVGNPNATRLVRRDEAAKAAGLAENGLSLVEIGAALGVSRSSAWRLVHAGRAVA
jgi:hypothetical protein